MPPELRTERLLLRRWPPDDRDPFAAMGADPEVMRYFPAPLSAMESEELAARADGLFESRGFGLWALEHLESGIFIGFTGIAPMAAGVPGAPELELGWRLARDFWGHGCASEAARASAAFAFEQLGTESLGAITAVANTPSRSVMERIGMNFAGEFTHPKLSLDSPLSSHVLYLLRRPEAPSPGNSER